MWIKEIIIEGFKSYAQRTVISCLDPEFNAITGLNGSGKSNILDAILFCLGLSKEYDTLRIKKLQELIYKNGAAGVTKAEVTIVFDNRNKEQSPIGYVECEKITVTRQITADKSKYFINGKSETQKNFKNMFRSVQLNIDNPHFLVAQGRITKIINLKPQELIGMLEETAGTSLYNEKKREAQKLIQKKEEKLKQVNELIESEIQPQMQKLIEEKNLLSLYRAQSAQNLQIEKELHQYEYFHKAKALRMKKNDQQNVQDQLSIQQEKQQYENSEIKAIQENINRINDTNKNNKYESVQQKYKETQQQIQQLEKKVQISKKGQENAENEKIKLEQQQKTCIVEKERADIKIVQTEKNLKQMTAELKDKKDMLDEQIGQQQQTDDANNIQATNQLLQRSIQETQSQIYTYQRELEQFQLKLQRNEENIQKSKKDFENAKTDAVNLEKKIDFTKQKIQGYEQELQKAITIENQLQFLKQQRNDLDQQVYDVKNKLSSQPATFKLNLSRMTNWDQNRVYGKLFNLFEIKDDQYMKALEFGAGAKLQNIVVDDSSTSTYLLKNNILQTHAYIIPNKEINYIEVKEDLIKKANDIAKQYDGFAKPAIQLVSFQDNVSNSMKFVFGNFLIASTMDIATKIAYDPINTQKLKVVTKDGDIIDPSGTLTGGYSNDKFQQLPKLKFVNRLLAELKELQIKIDQIEKEIIEKKKEIEYHEQLRSNLQQDKSELDNLINRQKRISNFSFQSEQEKCLNNKKDCEEQIEKINKYIQEAENKMKELTKDQKSIQSGKSAKELLKTQVDRTKKEIEKLKLQIDQHKQQLYELQAESKNYKFEIEKCIKNIDEETINLEKETQQLNQTINKLNQLKEQYQLIIEEKNKLESNNAILNNNLARLNEQLQERQKYLNQTNDLINTNQNEYKKLEREIFDLNKETKELEKQKYIIDNIQELNKDKLQGEFVKIEKLEYDKLKNQYQKLIHDQEKLSKQVNFKVESMTEQVEKEFQSLKDKKLILENDKTMLQKNMSDLDEKKILTIEKCFLEVNKDFSSIFTSLLKNAQAKLGRLDGMNIEDGIEMNVSFSHQQKNLSELSGGQRSLLALSFILALLKYKPAPFYILDEVDSALDLSHTENIGQMLAQNFKQSQFLLISLKEGMYQNANVLYKVQFIDGVSKIDRHELKKKKQLKQ